jgi:simple sugar transport system ATP-binding protein
VATVHRLLIEAAESGVGILLVSEDLEEVRALADRVAVIYEGSIMAVLDSRDATVHRLGLLMGGSRDVGEQS